MVELSMFLLSWLFILPTLLLLFIINKNNFLQTTRKSQSTQPNLPKSYPIIGHLIVAYQQKDRFQWLTRLLISSPSSTFIFHRPFGLESIQTADPTVVEHILKTKFHVYQKGSFQSDVVRDFLGDGIFNVDGEFWKFQRKVASHEFNTKSLRKFVENVVDHEVSNRLVPLLSQAAKNDKVLDLQDILQRFTFDNICKIAFGYDPNYLSPDLPRGEFAEAFEEAAMISMKRFHTFFPVSWKICRFLNFGSEKRLKNAILVVRDFANSIVKQKKQDTMKSSMGENEMSLESEDLLSRFIKSGEFDEKFVTDIVISFILAGRDTTSSALTWFFWLLHKNKQAEKEVRKEIAKNRGKQGKETEDSSSSIYEDMKDMSYTHAALCESMRLYPPVPVGMKEAIDNDILPDGTPVKKGTRVTYHPYAMGRLEKLWGSDYAQYRPERWLMEEDDGEGKKWKFVARDSYSYPVFHGGPRVCLGKEMAFLQMKRVVAGVLDRFRVVPAVKEGFEPVYVPYMTAKMHGGFPVRIQDNVIRHIV